MKNASFTSTLSKYSRNSCSSYTVLMSGSIGGSGDGRDESAPYVDGAGGYGAVRCEAK